MTIPGRHSFYDLDSSWLEYMAADPKKRREICRQHLEAEAVTAFVGFVIVVGVLVLALVKGYFG